MIFKFTQNPFIKARDSMNTKNLLHFHIEYFPKATIQAIDYHKDFHFLYSLAIYLKNSYISFFIPFQNSSDSVDC